MNSRFHALRRQHEKLDEQVHAEMKGPRPDHLLLQGLKRRKLRIKDEMHQLLSACRQRRAHCRQT